MSDYEVRCKNNTNILITEDDDDIRMSVWMLGGHATTTMTKEQAKKLIEALEEAVEEAA